MSRLINKDNYYSQNDSSECNKRGEIELPVVVGLGSKIMIDNRRFQLTIDRINIVQ